MFRPSSGCVVSAMGRLVFLVVVLLGVGVGYLLGTMQGSGNTLRRGDTRRETPAASKSEQSQQDSGLAAALAALPVPDVAARTGRITGTVSGARGDGVAGVTVRAVLRRIEANRRDRVEPGLEEAVRTFVRQRSLRLQTTVDATTSANGTYVLRGLTDGAYRVTASLSGFELRGGGTLTRAGMTVDFTAHPVVEIAIDVLLPDGSRPARAWIKCKRGGQDEITRDWYRQPGTVRVPPGSYVVAASVRDGDELKSDAVEVTVPLGKTPERVVIHLRGRPGIRGTIMFADGVDFSGISLYALSFQAGQQPDEELLRKNGTQAWAFKRGTVAMTYAFQDLPDGRYVVGAALGEGPLLGARVVVVAGRVATCDFRDLKIPPSQYVVVSVLGPDDKPTPVKEIETSYRVDGSYTSGGGSWTRRDNGALLVLHCGRSGAASGGTYGVKITTEKYGHKEVTYRGTKARELTVRFRSAATLQVTVRGYLGSEHKSRVVFALERKTDRKRPIDIASMADPERGLKVDANGMLRAGPVEEGEYVLFVDVRAGDYQFFEATRHPVTLRPGKNSLIVPMPRLYALAVVATGFDPGDLVSLRRVGGRDWYMVNGRIDKDRKVHFNNLPAGKYKIESKVGAMEIARPGPAEVVFALLKPNALLVRITDTESSFARTGLRDGDLIVVIDGTEFKSAPELAAAMAAARLKDEVVMSVVRGSRRLEITVDAKKLLTDDGGSVEPTRR